MVCAGGNNVLLLLLLLINSRLQLMSYCYSSFTQTNQQKGSMTEYCGSVDKNNVSYGQMNQKWNLPEMSYF